MDHLICVRIFTFPESKHLENKRNKGAKRAELEARPALRTDWLSGGEAGKLECSGTACSEVAPCTLSCWLGV